MYKPNAKLAKIAEQHPEHADDLAAVSNHIDALRTALSIVRSRLRKITELASIVGIEGRAAAGDPDAQADLEILSSVKETDK